MKSYCITHNVVTELPWDMMDECIFTSCPPPELPDNWIDFVIEPSPEELARMNLNAKELEISL